MEKIAIRFQEIITKENSPLYLFSGYGTSADVIKSVYREHGYHAKLNGNVLELSKNSGCFKRSYMVELDNQIHASNLHEIFHKHSFTYDTVKHQKVMARTAQLQLLSVIRYINTGL